MQNTRCLDLIVLKNTLTLSPFKDGRTQVEVGGEPRLTHRATQQIIAGSIVKRGYNFRAKSTSRCW